MCERDGGVWKKAHDRQGEQLLLFQREPPCRMHQCGFIQWTSHTTSLLTLKTCRKDGVTTTHCFFHAVLIKPFVSCRVIGERGERGRRWS